jgi:primosomal protein N' (replication factor Y)
MRKRFGLPPWRRMARVVIRDASEERAREVAEVLARQLSDAAESTGGGNEGSVDVVGPMPCPIARIADRWRMQVEVTAPGAAALGRFLTAARNRGVLVPGEAVAVDVDPVALM